MKPFFDDCPCCQAMARDGFAGIPEDGDPDDPFFVFEGEPLTPATLFPPGGVDLEVVPGDDEEYPLGHHECIEPVLAGLLASERDLRVATLIVSLEGRQAFTYEVPLVLARGRGAWVVGWSWDDAAAAAREAVELRAVIVAVLCEVLGWSPAEIPVASTAIVLERDPTPDTPGPLAASDLIGRSDLPRLAQRLRAIPVCLSERHGHPIDPLVAGRFFAALCTVGDLLPACESGKRIELPRWLLEPTAP